MATLAEVAAVAGVSTSAVSRYLNGKIELPKVTAMRIDAAVIELDYRPNLLGRRLSTGRTDVIGIATPAINEIFFGIIAAAALKEANRHGYSLNVTATGDRDARDVAALSALRSHFVDGILVAVADANEAAHLVRGLSGKEPIILLDEDIPGCSLPRILLENEEGAYCATSHLIAAGHRRIVHVGGPRGLSSHEERRRGFLRAMAEAGLTVDEDDVGACNNDAWAGMAAAERLMTRANPPTAVFAGTDNIGLGVVWYCRGRGIGVPADLSVVGFGDLPFAGRLQPAMTTMRLPLAEMGQIAVTTLLARLRGESVPISVRLPCTFIRGGSVAPPGDWEV